MPPIHSLKTAFMAAASPGASCQTSTQSAGLAILVARANNERVNKVRRRAVISRAGLVGLDREQAGALQKFVGVVIELLLVGALRRHRRAFGRRVIVGFRTELVEARLDFGEARRQTVERTRRPRPKSDRSADARPGDPHRSDRDARGLLQFALGKR